MNIRMQMENTFRLKHKHDLDTTKFVAIMPKSRHKIKNCSDTW